MTKRIAQRFLLFASLLSSVSALAQSTVPSIDSGSINGARYQIAFPKGWTTAPVKRLVMFAHGYEFVGAPAQSRSNRWLNTVQPFLERGFAVAASDYRKQGFALPEGVDDTEALRAFFVKKYGQPDTTIVVGQSMGGGVALATLENFGHYYQGGLPMCPLSSRPYLQCRKEFDMYATFNGLFPGVVTSLAEIFDVSKPYQAQSANTMQAKATAIRKAIFAKDSLLAIAFAKRFDLKMDDLPFSLFFNENVLRDIAQQAKGNPFDNTNTLYSGFPNDLVVNQKAERLAATVSPDVLFGKYDRTGNINRPVVLLHTVYDQLIPPQYGVMNFENMIHKQGKDALFVVKYTNGQGHCQFKPQQVATAFDALRQWIATGQKAKAGLID
ncbi:alpha/beta hydrolase [Spirosoma endbachense]|uniref:Alpha/beta fold hydrolase n=1 Tax=Spirosoma endbachense TaxID=2666025 RepID=A0A6P1W977_9BACT|nr:alpha/beta fold hydrolase [Spirosoma endbachense]QHW00461.1 alpha/beta fold hydrolase [Spirosoma endbachense]